jgi:hypothetical protein
MILLGLSWSGISRLIIEVRRSYESYFSKNPSLPTAVLLYQCVLFGSGGAALYAVWVLYQRERGTLVAVKGALITTIGLRIVADWIFDLVARLPDGSSRFDAKRALVLAAYATVWYLYLSRSRRVKQIYGASSEISD